MKLTDRIEVPRWLRRAVPPAFSLFLLWCAIDFLNWEFMLPLRHSGLFEMSAQRCFSNAEPLMPLAALIHGVLCPVNELSRDQGSTQVFHDHLVWVCLYGEVVIVWLTARALSGWWGAGVAAAFIATSPFLFALDNQVSPASLGVLLATLTCWLAVEAFGRTERRGVVLWQRLWLSAALLAIATQVDNGWLVIAQGIYALVQRRKIGVSTALVAGVVSTCAVAVVAAAFIPARSIAAAIVRADVRAAPASIFALSYPDEWMRQPHMATYVSILVLLVLVAGAVAARSTALPYFVVVVFMQALTALVFGAGELIKATSLAYVLPVGAMTLGATTSFLIQRKPHMLAFVVPAFAVAAQYAAFGRLPLQPDELFDFDNSPAPPVAAFVAGDRTRLYHDRRHADRVTVYLTMHDSVYNRDAVIKPATSAVAVTAVIPYRDAERRITYAYQITARDNSWRGFLSNNLPMWREPPVGRCIRQPYSKVRLYERPDVAYREDGHSILEPPGTIFQVLEINAGPYQPELRVRDVRGANRGREGWIYAQTVMFGSAAEVSRAANYPCT